MKQHWPERAFAGKELFMEELLQDASPIEILENIMEEIDKRERGCLVRVYTRFCWLKGLEINFDLITPVGVQDKPNYTAYYFMFGTPSQFFLMSRELIIEDGVPKLNVVFNRELLNEDKDNG